MTVLFSVNVNNRRISLRLSLLALKQIKSFFFFFLLSRASRVVTSKHVILHFQGLGCLKKEKKFCRD